MELLLSVPGLVMIVGMVLYMMVPPAAALSSHAANYWPKIQQLALVMFGCGLLAMLFRASARSLF
jgi:hypothetical protein